VGATRPVRAKESAREARGACTKGDALLRSGLDNNGSSGGIARDELARQRPITRLWSYRLIRGKHVIILQLASGSRSLAPCTTSLGNGYM
jgi:hypothetical protein